MPDAAGNLYKEDFLDQTVVRFVSYLDPDVVLACAFTGNAYVHRLSNGPHAPDQDDSLFRIGTLQNPNGRPAAPDGFFYLHPMCQDYIPRAEYYDEDPTMMVLACSIVSDDDSVDGSLLSAVDWQAHFYHPEELFTVDMVDGCWFALNNHDRSAVADVNGSGTAEGNTISGWSWNGGDNQRWRAEPVAMPGEVHVD